MRRRATACLVALSLLVAAAAGCRRGGIERVEWPVMGTVAAVQIRNPSGLSGCAASTNSVKLVFSEVERLLNAHDPKSELSFLAPLSEDEILSRCDKGGPRKLPWLSVRPCYEAAFRLARASGGAFNPRWRGTNALDLGAIAKGFAVDVAETTCYVTNADALIDLGGNVKAIKTENGSRRPWRTGVRDPNGDGYAAKVDLREGEALATSATYYRGSHIRDGRTGCVVSNGVASVTVLCRSAMWADGLSTTLFVLGPDEGRAFLARHVRELCGDDPVSVLWILDGGGVVASDPENRFQR